MVEEEGEGATVRSRNERGRGVGGVPVPGCGMPETQPTSSSPAVPQAELAALLVVGAEKETSVPITQVQCPKSSTDSNGGWTARGEKVEFVCMSVP